MKRLMLVIGLAITLVLLLPAATTLADYVPQTQSIALQVSAGFDGFYKEGEWVPLRVLVSNDGPDIKGSLRAVDDRVGASNVIYSRPIDLPNESRKEVFLYFSASNFISDLDVELVDDASERSLASTTVTLKQVNRNDILYGVFSDNPSELGQLAMVTPVNGNSQIAVLDIADLPSLAEAWRALDVIVFSDVDTARMEPDQQEALRAWLSSGGRLVVTGGLGWQRTAAGLDALLPVDLTGTMMLDDLSSLATLSNDTSAQLNSEARVSVAQPRPGSTVQVQQDGTPIWVWRELGQGRVDYLSADPALEPLRSYNNIDELWRVILSQPTVVPIWSNGFNVNFHNARNAVASIPGVSLPSVLQLCGFLTIYIVMIGPGNYIVLKRMRRTELAWFTIPAFVVAFSAIAYFSGFRLRGSKAVVHQVAIVQSWPDSDVARVDGLVGLWSPRRTRYDIQVDGQYLTSPLPDSTGGLTSITDRLIEQGQGNLLPDLRMDIGSIRAFVVQGYEPSRQLESDLKFTFGDSGTMQATGTIRNTSGLDLEDVVLLLGGTVQRIGDVLDGEQVSVNTRLLLGPANPAGSHGLGLGKSSNSVSSGGFTNAPDTTIDDILGDINFCFGDRELERRCNLLNAIIDRFSDETSGHREGMYLVGWADASPLDVSAVNTASEQVNTAVYFFELPFEVEHPNQTLIVPPGLMTWQLLDADIDGGVLPYGLFLSSSRLSTAFRYQPLSFASLDTVSRLTIHLDSLNPSAPPPRVELWDWQTASWKVIQADWGDTFLSNPEQYIAADNAVNVRVSLPDGNSVLTLERIDLTLEGRSAP